MRTHVILSVIGSDRPGLTRELAQAIQEAGGNWLESHLGRLGGKYVGSVLVEIDAAAIPMLERAAARVDAHGLAVAMVRAEEPPSEPEQCLVVELIGQDRPGIVREVTEAIAELAVNIETLTTGLRSGAWSGERLFHARAEVILPEGLHADRVRDALEQLSGEIMVDFEFKTRES